MGAQLLLLNLTVNSRFGSVSAAVGDSNRLTLHSMAEKHGHAVEEWLVFLSHGKYRRLKGNIHREEHGSLYPSTQHYGLRPDSKILYIKMYFKSNNNNYSECPALEVLMTPGHLIRRELTCLFFR